MKEKIITSFKRVCKLGWRNFSREGGLSFVAVFVLVVTISLTTSLFFLQDIAGIVMEEVERRADITIDFNLAVSEEKIFELKEEIAKEFDINGMEYISREEVKDDFVDRYGDRPAVMESLEEVGNPFPASLNIRADDAFVYTQTANFVESNYPEMVYNIDFYQRKDIIEGIFSATESARRGGIIVSVILGLIAIILVYNTTKLAIYGLKEEIRVMRLVGSSNFFIQGSFIIQGLLMGFFAALISFLLFLFFTFLAPQTYNITLGIDLHQYFLQNISTIVLLQFAVGIVLGTFSSIIATSRYLKI